VSAQDAVRRAVGQAFELLKHGHGRDALALLEAAGIDHPTAVDIPLQKAAAWHVLGNLPEALRALEKVLAIDPYHFVALLSKGTVLERMSRPRAAARVYQDVLKIAPRPESIPLELAARLHHAREVVAAESARLAEYLRAATRDLHAAHESHALARVDECLDVLAGTKRVFHSEPIQLHVPRLPAIPFFDRSHFPWLERLEAATDVIRDELLALQSAGMPGFAPYIDLAPGTPVNQWGELNRSADWSSYWLWRDGDPQHEAMARCPETSAVLAELPLADQPGFAPTALFSALAPKTRIPPHTGATNARLLVHLPLVLPGPAGFRVGNEERQWRLHEAWVFDDTIEHEAWNDAEETRVILIFDIWNPLLSAAERELISAMMLARDAWLAEESGATAAALRRTPP